MNHANDILSQSLSLPPEDRETIAFQLLAKK